MTGTLQPSMTPLAPGEAHVFPTTPAQQRFWVLDQLDQASGAYTIPIAARLRGALDVAALRAALQMLVDRHEALRTTFTLDGAAPVMVVAERVDLPFRIVDLSDRPAAERESAAVSAATTAANAPFDLATGPLIRAELLRLDAADHVLLLTLHHIIADGASVGILFREMAAAYGAIASGAAVDLPEVPLQYADFAVWQRRMLDGGAADRHVSYWRERLQSLPVLDLPTDHPRPAVLSSAGSKRESCLPPALVADVRALARAHHATPFVAFLAAYAALLHRCSGDTDLVIGSITAGRTRAEAEHTVGLFLNTLPLRVDLAGDPTFAELIDRVRDVATGALANAEIPFERMVEVASFERDPSRTPVFQAAFQLLEGVAGELVLDGVSVERLEREKLTTKFEITLMLNGAPDGALRSVLEFSSDLYDASTADRLLAQYATLLASGVASPHARLSALALVEPRELAAHRARWNPPATPRPQWTTPARVVAQAAATPDAVAVVAGADALTYAELARRSAIVARHLEAAGVRRGDNVVVMMDRTVALPVALLGVHRAGAAYVPVDPAYPADRIAQVLEDSRSPVLLVDGASLPRVPAADAATIVVSEAWWSESVEPGAAVAVPELDPESLAYVIYTSGSTGRPKGVMIPHRALANFLDSMSRVPGLASGDAIVAVTTVAFDIAGLELWLPLVTGARVVIAARSVAVDGAALRALVERTVAATAGRTMLQATPATWRLLLEAGWRGSTAMVLLCGGEAWPAGLAAQLLPCGSELWNVYGPTETTIWSTAGRVVSPDRVALGAPIANTTLYIIEPGGTLAPAGVPGELWIGGAGVAAGYFGRPDLTAERFIDHPDLGRVYRTGDRVRRLDDGSIEFLGRLDDQVKVRGYRVELGEIEAAMARVNGVAHAVAAARHDGVGARLVGYVVLRAGDTAETVLPVLREHLRRVLPEYMVPTAIMVLDAIPLTPNGKVNRRALPTPAMDDFTFGRPHVPPRTAVEDQVAALWAEVLQRDRVGVHDDFFALGGHSLLAMRVLAGVRTRFGIDLAIADVFAARTVAALADLVERQISSMLTADPALSAALEALEGMTEEEALRLLAQQTGGGAP